MNLFETLKQFKNISPDPAYKEKSKRAILATVPHERLSVWRIIARALETGTAVALTIFFILIITGQFSNIPYVSPVKFSVINPETLRAEAQAVDIQIQLADVAYQETTSTPVAIAANETTPQMATASGTSAPTAAGFASMALRASGASSSSATSSVATAASASSTTTTSTVVSVDQALQALSQ